MDVMKFYSNLLFLPVDGKWQYDHGMVLDRLNQKASCRPDYTCIKNSFLGAYCKLLFISGAGKWLAAINAIKGINFYGIVGATTKTEMNSLLGSSLFSQLTDVYTTVFKAYVAISTIPDIAQVYMSNLNLCASRYCG